MKITTLAVLLMASSGLYAETIDMKKAEESALLNNPALSKARIEIRKSREDIHLGLTKFMPQANLSYSMSRSPDTEDSSSYGVSVSLPLFSGFGDISSLKSAVADCDIQELYLQKTVNETVYALKNSFYELLWSQENEKLSGEILKRRAQNYDMIKLKYEAGREDKGALLEAEANVESAKFELEKAGRRSRLASYELQKNMGMDSFKETKAEGNFSVQEFSSTLAPEELAKSTIDYKLQEYALKKAGYALTSARSGYYPSVSASGRSSTNKSGSTESDSESYGLSLSYPVFSQGRVFHDAKKAGLNLETAKASFLETKRAVAVQVLSAVNDFENALQNVSVSGKSLEASKGQAEITTTKYINGLVSYYEWQSAENNFINAQRALLSAQKDAAVKRAFLNSILCIGD